MAAETFNHEVALRAGSPERFDELSLRYLDGLLVPEEFKEFSTRLREDEVCRDQFVTLCVQTSLLLEEERADEEIMAACEVNRNSLTAQNALRAVGFSNPAIGEKSSASNPPLGFIQAALTRITGLWRKLLSPTL